MEQVNKPIKETTKGPSNVDNLKASTYRHLIQINLTSVKRYFENDKNKDDLKEYYFEVGERSNRSRTPTHGYFTLGLNTEDQNPVNLTLYSRFYEGEKGEKIEIPVWIKEKNDKLMKFDDTISFKMLDFKLGSKEDEFSMKEAGTELKISLHADKTRM